MAIIKPFCAWRPLPSVAEHLACRPYDVMNRQEAKMQAHDNKLSFLHVIRAEIDLPDDIDEHHPSVYEQAKKAFEKFAQNGIFVQDPNACLYVYEQEWRGRTQTGIMTLLDVADYEQDIIKKHEHTRPEKEQDRITHILTTCLHSEPILTAYRQINEIDAIVAAICAQTPCYNFSTDDGIRHTFWVIEQPKTIEQLCILFKERVPVIYIADGHHRAASSAKVAQKMRNENPAHNGEEAYNSILAVVFPDKQLQIIDYNRVVKSLNGWNNADFLAQVAQKFQVETVPSAYQPDSPRHFGMYFNRQWYQLTASEQLYTSQNPVDLLDISILSEHLLKPILGIEDQRTDKRIEFVGGIRGLKELQQRVDSGEMAVAFAIYPVSMQQLLSVADAGQVMPPKSTWFEPKLRSGLAVHAF